MPQERWFKNRLFQGIAWSVLCCFMAVQILASFGAPLAKYDEAIPLVAADLMLHGRKAAVDFLSFYPPLYYYLILAGFQSVGRSALVPTFFAAVMYVVFSIAVARFFWKSFRIFGRWRLPYLPHCDCDWSVQLFGVAWICRFFPLAHRIHQEQKRSFA